MKKRLTLILFCLNFISLYGQYLEPELPNVKPTANVAAIDSLNYQTLSGALRQLVWVDDVNCFVFGDDQAVYGYDQTCRLKWVIKARAKIHGWLVHGNDLYVMDGPVLGQYDIESFQGTAINYPINAVNIRSFETFTHYSSSESKSKYVDFFKNPAETVIAPPIIVGNIIYILGQIGTNRKLGIVGFPFNLTAQTFQSYLNDGHPQPTDYRLFHTVEDGHSLLCFPSFNNSIVYVKINGSALEFDHLKQFPKSTYDPNHFLPFKLYRNTQRERLDKYRAQMTDDQGTVFYSAGSRYQSNYQGYDPLLSYSATLVQSENKQQLLISKASSQPYSWESYTTILLTNPNQFLPTFSGSQTTNLPTKNTSIKAFNIVDQNNSQRIKIIGEPYLLKKGGANYLYALIGEKDYMIQRKPTTISFCQYKIPDQANPVFTQQWKKNWQDDHTGKGPIAKQTSYSLEQLKKIVDASKPTFPPVLAELPCNNPSDAMSVVEREKQIKFAEMDPKMYQFFKPLFEHRLLKIDQQKWGINRFIFSTITAEFNDYAFLARFSFPTIDDNESNAKVNAIDSIKKDLVFYKTTLPAKYDEMTLALQKRKSYWDKKLSLLAQNTNDRFYTQFVVDGYANIITNWIAATKENSGGYHHMYQFKKRSLELATTCEQVLLYLEYYSQKLYPLEVWHLTAPLLNRP